MLDNRTTFADVYFIVYASYTCNNAKENKMRKKFLLVVDSAYIDLEQADNNKVKLNRFGIEVLNS